jgi:hypothetical protein
LKQLQCGKCEWLVDLQLPPHLVKLDCSGCYNLRQLVASNHQQLNSLNCGGCYELEKLDVSNCQQLRMLKFNSCSRLQVLDVSNCPQLKNLDCKGLTKLEQLNLSDCQQLKNLDCTNCANLHVLDLSSTSQLARLICHGCDNLEVTSLPTSLLSLHCHPCIDMTELLRNVPSGLRCLGIRYSVKWRDLLQACTLLTKLTLHSSYLYDQLVVGSTSVSIGSSLQGLCECNICRECIPRGDVVLNDDSASVEESEEEDTGV